MRFVQSTVDERGRRLHRCLFRPMAEVSFLLPAEYLEKEVSVCREFKLSPKVQKGAVVNKANQK